MDAGGRQYEVMTITIHKEYDYSLRINDIAILKIKGLFDFQYVNILSFYTKELVEGDLVTLSGFGAQQVARMFY